jgi:hypothetical protein
MADSSNTPRIVAFGNLVGVGILLVGIAAIVLACAFVIRTLHDQAASPHFPRSAEQSQSKESHEFQLIQLGEMRRDQFLLDKKTGRVWIKVCTGQVVGPDCKGQLVWQGMQVEGLPSASNPASIFSDLPTRPHNSK